jgi:hypothetical protein
MKKNKSAISKSIVLNSVTKQGAEGNVNTNESNKVSDHIILRVILSIITYHQLILH